MPNNSIYSEEMTTRRQDGQLTLAEVMYFLGKVDNKRALFRGEIFANDQYKDESTQIEFTLDSKLLGYNLTKSVLV